MLLQQKRCTSDGYRCVTNCTTRTWTIGPCHNDGGSDFADRVLPTETAFDRTFYASADGSCTGAEGAPLTIPFDECIGPFGTPRPIGMYSLVPAREEE